ncbi:unnamed protein product, partial [Ixodes pacificus]
MPRRGPRKNGPLPRNVDRVQLARNRFSPEETKAAKKETSEKQRAGRQRGGASGGGEGGSSPRCGVAGSRKFPTSSASACKADDGDCRVPSVRGLVVVFATHFFPVPAPSSPWRVAWKPAVAFVGCGAGTWGTAASPRTLHPPPP